MSNPVVCNPKSLADLVRKGDVNALDRITRCHGQRMMSVGIAWCRTHEDAQDAVQDALVAAGSNLTAWRGDGPLEGWLVRMVMNACRRMRRGRKNDPGLHLTEVDMASGGGSPEEVASNGEIAVAIGRTLDALSPEDRALVLMVDAEGWAPSEVAAQTGIGAATVRTRLFRARARMKRAFEEFAPPGETLPTSGGSEG